MSRVKAVWGVTLYATCPKCEEEFDMMDDGGVLDMIGDGCFAVCENGTDASRGIAAECLHCGYEFLVDLEY